jgi:hypothetical protein
MKIYKCVLLFSPGAQLVGPDDVGRGDEHRGRGEDQGVRRDRAGAD